MKLARFRPNRVRPDEDPELVASRNFDGLSATLEKAFGAIEGESSSVAKSLARKANATNPVIRGLLTILGGIADLSLLSVTGNTTLTSGNGTVEADATGGSLTITLPPAASSKGLLYQIFKVDTSTNTVTVDANASETIDGALTIVLGGNVGNSRLFIYCNGTNWRIRDLYEEGIYTATLTGCTTSPTVTATYTRNGNRVDLFIPDVTATSNSTACTLTGLPSHIQPVRQIRLSIPEVEDAGLFYVGSAQLNSGSGTIVLYRVTSATSGNTSVFTNSATTKGLSAPSMISYTLL